jgi:hypothetical protein
VEGGAWSGTARRISNVERRISNDEVNGKRWGKNGQKAALIKAKGERRKQVARGERRGMRARAKFLD